MKRVTHRETCDREFRKTLFAGSVLLFLPLCVLILNAEFYLSSILSSQIVLHLCHFIQTVIPSMFNILLMITVIACILLILACFLKSLYHFGKGLTYPPFMKPLIAEVWNKGKQNQRSVDTFPIVEVENPVPFALAGGIIDKKIFLSNSLKDMLTSEEIEAVLFHEAGHLRMNHPCKRVLVNAILNTIIFIPFKKGFFRKFKILTELAADEFAVLSGVDRAVLAGAIMKMAKKHHVMETGALAGFTDSEITERIHSLLGLEMQREKAGTERYFETAKVLRLFPVLILTIFLALPFINRPDSTYCTSQHGELDHAGHTAKLISLCTELDCGKCDICSPAYRKNL